MSTRLLESIFENNDFDFPRSDVDLIADMIEGNYTKYLWEDSPHWNMVWAFDIVNNKRNSLDVDKYDYLLWDSSSVQMSISA